MSYGNSVTELTQKAVGQYGYIIKIDTTGLLAYKIEMVQAQILPINTPAVISSPVSNAVLYNYLNDPNCPNLAFNYSNNQCSIFFKIDAFPYTSTTRYALFGKRISQNCLTDADYLDCPNKHLNLLTYYCLSLGYTTVKKGVPTYIKEAIEANEREALDGG